MSVKARAIGAPFGVRIGLIFGGLLLSMVIAAACILAFSDPETEAARARPGVMGYSAIGHRLLFELLQAAGHPVRTSRDRRPLNEDADDLLVIFEASPDDLRRLMTRTDDEIYASRRVLVVLPKREARVDQEDRGRIESETLRPIFEVEECAQPFNRLNGIRVDAIVRPDANPTWEYQLAEQLDDRLAFADRIPGPTLGDAQLLAATGLYPILWAAGGSLLSELDYSPEWRASHFDVHALPAPRFFVLSDPDLVANHGLGAGQNARLALEIFGLLAGPGGTVTFDLTAQGFGSTAGFWRRLTQPPAAYVLLHLALVALVFLAAGFATLPQHRRLREPKSAAVRMARHLAGVLQHRGAAGTTLTTLKEQEQRRVLKALGLHRLAAADRLDRLREQESRLGIPEDRRLQALNARIRKISATDSLRSKAMRAEALHLAAALGQWRQSLIHGSGKTR